MEEILKQILESIKELQQGQQKLEKGQQEMRQDLQQQINGMQQQITDLRDSMFIEFEQSHKEMGAMRDMQTEALQRWKMSTVIMERVETLLDERKEEVVAIEATMVDHGRRITKLEKRAV